MITPAAPSTWKEFAREIATIYLPPGHAPNTHAKMIHTLQLAEAFGIGSLDQLTTAWVARFIAWRAESVTTNTIRGDVSYLAAAAAIAVEEGWTDRAPAWRRVKPRPGPARRKNLHAIEDVRAVLSLLTLRSSLWKEHRLLAVAATAACTGLRKQEVLRLRIEDVDLDARILRVVERRRRLKTLGSARRVPICPELSIVLGGWMPRTECDWLFPGVKRLGPWTGGTSGKCPTDRLKAAGRAVGVEGLTLNSLRHTFATWSRRRWGISGLKLRDFLGHTTEHTQEHYVHEETDVTAFVATVDRVSYLTSA